MDDKGRGAKVVFCIAAGRGKEHQPATKSWIMNPLGNPPEPRYVTVDCQHCDGGIEFDANELEGDKTRNVECPHCHLETIVFDPEPETPVISPEQPANESQDSVMPALPSANLASPETLHASHDFVADIEELSAVTRHFADVLGIEIDTEAIERIARSAVGAPLEVLNRLRRVRDYARAKGDDKKITVDTAEEALKAPPKSGITNETNASANNQATEIQPRREEIPAQEPLKRLPKAAEQGQAQAEGSPGSACFKGPGASENQAETVKRWYKAAKQGQVTAQIHLSEIYETGDGVTQDLVAAYKWAKLSAAQGREEAQKKCEALVLKMNPEQIEAVEPKDQILWKHQRLMPKQFSDFIGQKRAKARLELAVAAAKSRGEPLGHILLIGSPGSGTATLASIVARAMGASLKSTCGYAIEKAGNLAGLLTEREAGDLLFIDEIHRLRMDLAEYLYPAIKDFKLDMIISEGPYARNVRQNLPRFTLVGTIPPKGRLPTAFLSCFSMIENMDAYSVEELTAIAHRFAGLLEFEMDGDAADQIARSADGTPQDVLNRLQHVRDYARVKGNGKITTEIAGEALKMLIPIDDSKETNGSRFAIPFEVRIKVWRRDNGKCVKCGSRQNLEFDHIIPVSKGGSNTARNIELLCENCNRFNSDYV
jgi:Holliday junction DNA helicase RuvB